MAGAIEMARVKKGFIEQLAATIATRIDAKEPRRIDVTPERAKRNKVQSAGMARKIVPVIDTLWDMGKITAAEYEALAYYRGQASQAEDDEATLGVLAPEKIMGGSAGSVPIGGYIPAKLLCTPAILETARIERDLGALREIARAIAVDDVSLSQWCIDRHGGRERYDGKGKFIAIVPIAEKRHMEFARLDLRMAARRISR